MYQIDFHSHILPGIDDGARNIATSLAMLDMIKDQHTDILVATPHFYASQDRISTFLERRKRSQDILFSALTKERPSDYPRILTGAEVAFFDGISKAEEIRHLTIENTNILLLEMPFVPWTERTLQEVAFLEQRGFRILIAHLERFLWIPGNKKQVQQLLELPVTIQINAEAFDGNWIHTRTLIHMFQNGKAHVLGSDCHGIHHRTPNLQKGREFLKKRAGSDILDKIDRQGNDFLFKKIAY